MQQHKKEILTTLAKIIKKRRIVSISQISNEIDLSKSIWSEIEKGKKDMQLSTLWRIAEALGTKPSELLKEAEDTLGEHFSFIENSK